MSASSMRFMCCLRRAVYNSRPPAQRTRRIVFQLRDLRHAYDGIDVLQIRDWLAAQGEHWLVIGPSGSGKTTLLHILAGFLKPSYGEVIVAGYPLAKLKTGPLGRFRARHV